jgi:hypothetical protein
MYKTSLVIKLQEAHGKEKFLLFTEKGLRIKIETFPANEVDVQRQFEYTVREKGYKNVSLILHTMALMLFYNFKTPLYQWLQLNKIYMTKTIFKSSKDNMVCIGHLTNINPQRIDCTQYQDQINKLLDAIAEEKHEKDPTFYKMHQTTSEYANYHVHLCTGSAFVKVAIQRYTREAIRVFVRQPFLMLAPELMQEIAPMILLKSKVKFVPATLKYDPMIKNNVDNYKTLIREQNSYLINYADF